MGMDTTSVGLELEHAGKDNYCLICQSRCKHHGDRKVRKGTPRAWKPPEHSEFDRRDMQLLRSRFDEWKQAHGIGPQTKLVSHPSFRTALSRIHNVHGYSFTDIGYMLGVSRERVRQYFSEAEIPATQKGGSMRVWSDDDNRFVLVDGVPEYRAIERRRSNVLLPHEIVPKRQSVVRWVIIDLGGWLGRAPQTTEVAEAFGHGGMTSRFVSWAGITTSAESTQTEQWNEIYRRAGYNERPRGHQGKNHHMYVTDQERADRWDDAVAKLRNLAVDLGRTPTSAEFSRATGRVNWVAWLRGRGAPWAETLDQLWKDAGMERP